MPFCRCCIVSHCYSVLKEGDGDAVGFLCKFLHSIQWKLSHIRAVIIVRDVYGNRVSLRAFCNLLLIILSNIHSDPFKYSGSVNIIFRVPFEFGKI